MEHEMEEISCDRNHGDVHVRSRPRKKRRIGEKDVEAEECEDECKECKECRGNESAERHILERLQQCGLWHLVTQHVKPFLIFTPLTNGELREAVQEWKEDASAVKRKYGPMELWDTRYITNMSDLFSGMNEFNEPIGGWNVSNVTDMSFMFWGATSFNQPIGGWDVCNVTDMACMFDGATSFNQPIGDWDVRNVTNMYYMFSGVTSFNQPIGSWDVRNVTNMTCMFQGATSFNQPVYAWEQGRSTRT